MSKSSSDRSGEIKASDSSSCKNYQQMYKRNVIATILFLGVAVSSLSLYHSAYYPIVLLPSYYAYRHDFIPPLMKFQVSFFIRNSSLFFIQNLSFSSPILIHSLSCSHHH